MTLQTPEVPLSIASPMASRWTEIHDSPGTEDPQEDLVVSVASQSTLIDRGGRGLM